MALDTPTTAELTATVVSQLEAALSTTFPLLPKSFTRVLAKALAGTTLLIYKYCGWILLQQFVQFASSSPTTINGVEVVPLLQIGRELGISDPTPATAAVLTVDVTVLTQTGNLSHPQLLVHNGSGVTYQTQSSPALDSGTIQVNVIAVRDQEGNGGVGTVGNREDGDELTFVNPIANVSRVTTVNTTVTTGLDAETWGAYRTRVLQRKQRPPQGGAYADYAAWGSTVSGVRNIYPYTSDPGEVHVYVEATTDIDADGIPTSGQLEAVEAAINLDVAGKATRRPAGAGVTAIAITRTAIDVTITGLTPDTTEIRADIAARLSEYMLSREPWIEGLSVLPRSNRVEQAAAGGVVSEVVNARGAAVVSVALEESGSPISAYSLDDGEKAKLGTVTYAASS